MKTYNNHPLSPADTPPEPCAIKSSSAPLSVHTYIIERRGPQPSLLASPSLNDAPPQYHYLSFPRAGPNSCIVALNYPPPSPVGASSARLSRIFVSFSRLPSPLSSVGSVAAIRRRACGSLPTPQPLSQSPSLPHLRPAILRQPLATRRLAP